MGLKFTTEGALKLTSMIVAVTGMAALLALIFEKFVLSAVMVLVMMLGCLAAIIIIRDEYDKTL